MHHTFCCAVDPVLIFGMSINEVSVNPETLPIFLTKILEKITIYITTSICRQFVPLGWGQFFFRSSLRCFGTDPVSNMGGFSGTAFVFVGMLAIFECGNMILNK